MDSPTVFCSALHPTGKHAGPFKPLFAMTTPAVLSSATAQEEDGGSTKLQVVVKAESVAASSSSQDEEDSVDAEVKMKVNSELESCKLPKGRCSLLNISKHSGLRYTHCLSRSTDPRMVRQLYKYGKLGLMLILRNLLAKGNRT